MALLLWLLVAVQLTLCSSLRVPRGRTVRGTAKTAKQRTILYGRDPNALIRILPPVTRTEYVMSKAVFDSMEGSGVFSAFSKGIESATIIDAINSKATPASLQQFSVSPAGTSVGTPLPANGNARDMLISSFLPFTWDQIFTVITRTNMNFRKKMKGKQLAGLIDCRSRKILGNSYERAIYQCPGVSQTAVISGDIVVMNDAFQNLDCSTPSCAFELQATIWNTVHMSILQAIRKGVEYACSKTAPVRPFPGDSSVFYVFGPTGEVIGTRKKPATSTKSQVRNKANPLKGRCADVRNSLRLWIRTGGQTPPANLSSVGEVTSSLLGAVDLKKRQLLYEEVEGREEADEEDKVYDDDEDDEEDITDQEILDEFGQETLTLLQQHERQRRRLPESASVNTKAFSQDLQSKATTSKKAKKEGKIAGRRELQSDDMRSDDMQAGSATQSGSASSHGVALAFQTNLNANLVAILTRGLLSEAAASAMIINEALSTLGNQLQASARYMMQKGIVNAQGKRQLATSPYIAAIANSQLGTAGVTNLNYKIIRLCMKGKVFITTRNTASKWKDGRFDFCNNVLPLPRIDALNSTRLGKGGAMKAPKGSRSPSSTKRSRSPSSSLSSWSSSSSSSSGAMQHIMTHAPNTPPSVLAVPPSVSSLFHKHHVMPGMSPGMTHTGMHGMPTGRSSSGSSSGGGRRRSRRPTSTPVSSGSSSGSSSGGGRMRSRRPTTAPVADDQISGSSSSSSSSSGGGGGRMRSPRPTSTPVSSSSSGSSSGGGRRRSRTPTSTPVSSGSSSSGSSSSSSSSSGGSGGSGGSSGGGRRRSPRPTRLVTDDQVTRPSSSMRPTARPSAQIPTARRSALPSSGFIPCSSNCPSPPARAPLCGFFQSCGNGCFCGTAPGVPSPFPTRVPTTNMFVLATPTRTPTFATFGTPSFDSTRGIPASPTKSPASATTGSASTGTAPARSALHPPTLFPAAVPVGNPTYQPTVSANVGAAPAPAPPAPAPAPGNSGGEVGSGDGGGDPGDHADPSVGSNSAGSTGSNAAQSLSDGAIAGIAVGVIFVVAVAGLAVYFAASRKGEAGVRRGLNGTMDEIYARKSGAEISRMSGDAGFAPYLAGQHNGRASFASRASMSRASMGAPESGNRASMGYARDSESRRPSLSAGRAINGQGGANRAGKYPAPRPSMSRQAPSYNASTASYEL